MTRTDPIFFLHHGQIDRIWWSWQRYSEDRPRQYNGKSRDDSSAEGMLTDELEFGGLLSSSPTIAEVMDTEGGILCYRYDSDLVGERDD